MLLGRRARRERRGASRPDRRAGRRDRRARRTPARVVNRAGLGANWFPRLRPLLPRAGFLSFGRSASETDRDGKRPFSIRAASPSFALLFPILLISRLA
jgi:hypothetical protein